MTAIEHQADIDARQVLGHVPEAAERTFHLTRYEARRAALHDLMAVSEALITEFADALPAGTVIRHIALAREQLLSAGVRAGLATAAEAMARLRLAAASEALQGSPG